MKNVPYKYNKFEVVVIAVIVKLLNCKYVANLQ